jgi:hypothetical protein
MEARPRRLMLGLRPNLRQLWCAIEHTHSLSNTLFPFSLSHTLSLSLFPGTSLSLLSS